MIVLKEERKCELVVKKSRFITVAKICNSISEVKRLVDEARTEYHDASHVVHAAVVGTQFSFSDDREPKNTAGRPTFEVLKGSGISNICVLIIRYFGGTLLGTGGLVKAYGDSVKLVLDGIVTEELVEKSTFLLTVPYELYDKVKMLLADSGATDIREKFETEITISGTLPKDDEQQFGSKISTLSCGKRSVLFS